MVIDKTDIAIKEIPYLWLSIIEKEKIKKRAPEKSEIDSVVNVINNPIKKKTPETKTLLLIKKKRKDKAKNGNVSKQCRNTF